MAFIIKMGNVRYFAIGVFMFESQSLNSATWRGPKILRMPVFDGHDIGLIPLCANNRKLITKNTTMRGINFGN